MKKILIPLTLMALLCAAAQAAEVSVLLKTGITRRGELAESEPGFVALRFKNGKVRQFDLAEVEKVIDKKTRKNLLPELLAAAAEEAEEPAAAAPGPAAAPAELQQPQPDPAAEEREQARAAVLAAAQAQAPSQPAPPPAEKKKMPGLILHLETGINTCAATGFSTGYEVKLPSTYGFGTAFKLVEPSPGGAFYINLQGHSFKAHGRKPTYANFTWNQFFTDITARYHWTTSAENRYWIGLGATTTSRSSSTKKYSGSVIELGMDELLYMAMGYRFITVAGAGGGPDTNLGGGYVVMGLRFNISH